MSDCCLAPSPRATSAFEAARLDARRPGLASIQRQVLRQLSQRVSGRRSALASVERSAHRSFHRSLRVGSASVPCGERQVHAARVAAAPLPVRPALEPLDDARDGPGSRCRSSASCRAQPRLTADEPDRRRCGAVNPIGIMLSRRVQLVIDGPHQRRNSGWHALCQTVSRLFERCRLRGQTVRATRDSRNCCIAW